jgi:hypothetical protein
MAETVAAYSMTALQVDRLFKEPGTPVFGPNVNKILIRPFEYEYRFTEYEYEYEFDLPSRAYRKDYVDGI